MLPCTPLVLGVLPCAVDTTDSRVDALCDELIAAEISIGKIVEIHQFMVQEMNKAVKTKFHWQQSKRARDAPDTAKCAASSHA